MQLWKIYDCKICKKLKRSLLVSHHFQLKQLENAGFSDPVSAAHMNHGYLKDFRVNEWHKFW